jgi:DNA-binding NarL/FixJ family response regulator
VATTILIVDDHAGFRAQARALLLAAGYDVVGEAQDGASALDAVRALEPEVVLLDVQLPDSTGFEIARSLRDEGTRSTIVLTSTREASDYRDRIPRSGARGFVPKAELSADALAAVLDGPG